VTEDNHEKTLRISVVPAEIRTEYLDNASIEGYRYTGTVLVVFLSPCGWTQRVANQ
jgi:hypothetical protein